MASELFELTMFAIVVGMVAIGLFIGYHAYRGFRRHESRPMRYLSVGLILLTAVAPVLGFASWIGIMYGYVPESLGEPISLVYRLIQFAGLGFIAYSLYKRP